MRKHQQTVVLINDEHLVIIGQMFSTHFQMTTTGKLMEVSNCCNRVPTYQLVVLFNCQNVGITDQGFCPNCSHQVSGIVTTIPIAEFWRQPT